MRICSRSSRSVKLVEDFAKEVHEEIRPVLARCAIRTVPSAFSLLSARKVSEASARGRTILRVAHNPRSRGRSMIEGPYGSSRPLGPAATPLYASGAVVGPSTFPRRSVCSVGRLPSNARRRSSLRSRSARQARPALGCEIDQAHPLVLGLMSGTLHFMRMMFRAADQHDVLLRHCRIPPPCRP